MPSPGSVMPSQPSTCVPTVAAAAQDGRLRCIGITTSAGKVEKIEKVKKVEKVEEFEKIVTPPKKPVKSKTSPFGRQLLHLREEGHRQLDRKAAYRICNQRAQRQRGQRGQHVVQPQRQAPSCKRASAQAHPGRRPG